MPVSPIKFTDKEVDLNGFISVKQVAQKLGFSKSKVYKLIEARLLRAYTDTGSSRGTKKLVPADVLDYVKVHFKANFSRIR